MTLSSQNALSGCIKNIFRALRKPPPDRGKLDLDLYIGITPSNAATVNVKCVKPPQTCLLRTF